MENKKALYIASLGASEKWNKYYESKISAAYEIGNHLIAFDKPSIKTNFCFGYGWSGVSTAEESVEAHESANNARTNEDYFLAENLEAFDKILEGIEAVEKNLTGCGKLDTLGCASGNDLKELGFAACGKAFEIVEIPYGNRWWHVDYTPLTLEEIRTYKDCILAEREKFVKRLNTYLKRYGLSKIHSWTYLVD